MSEETSKGGRPSLLTAQVQHRLLAALRAGAPRSAAAGLAGVAPRTLRDWMARGAGGEEVFADLHREVLLAESVCQLRALGLVLKSAQTDPKAAMWLLERRFPGEWSRAATERAAEQQQEREAREDAPTEEGGAGSEWWVTEPSP